MRLLMPNTVVAAALAIGWLSGTPHAVRAALEVYEAPISHGELIRMANSDDPNVRKQAEAILSKDIQHGWRSPINEALLACMRYSLDVENVSPETVNMMRQGADVEKLPFALWGMASMYKFGYGVPKDSGLAAIYEGRAVRAFVYEGGCKLKDRTLCFPDLSSYWKNVPCGPHARDAWKR